jgi:hypothetical protein
MSIVNLTADAAPPVTPSDTVNDPKGPFIGVLVWKAGTVSFLDAAGNSSGTSDSLAAGTVIAAKVVRVNATGTSATLLGYKGVA